MRIRFHGTEEELKELKKLLVELEEKKRIEVLEMSGKYYNRGKGLNQCFRVYLNIKI